MGEGRVLSISSSVVYGYVGNKASTFPMQLLGFDVDPINSVQLSNHTGYKIFRGQKLEGVDMDKLMEGLEKNDFLATYTHLMTGYLGKETFIERVSSIVLKMKERNKNLLFVCDPVMGDNGKLYVPEAFISIYRDKLIPHAALVTPNQFEAEKLSESKITDLDSAYQAAAQIVRRGAKNVVITSLELKGRQEDYIDVIAVGESIGKGRYYHLALPRQPGKYSGCGDLCTSLLLVWFTKHPGDFKAILEKTFASIQSVIRRTRTYGTKRCGWTELELIASRGDIALPKITQRASECQVSSACS
uniref:pyridoxal kinase n=1 Tax=Lotharella oceanica TaxID=641309 RepID=A0A7S2TLQ6_9EUKA